MTYDEVRSAGAEILRFAFTRIPTDGWREIDLDELRELNQRAEAEIQSATNARQHQLAVLLRESSATAIQRAEQGQRVFTVTWAGNQAFAATKGN